MTRFMPTNCLTPLLALACLPGLVTGVSAAIINTQATTQARVQELIEGEPGSINTDEGSTGTGATLPLESSAELLSTDLDGKLVSLGRGLGRFDDPTRLPQANPEEFSLEAACYSDSPSVSYAITSGATETRTVLFSTTGENGVPVEIDFDDENTRRVTSRIFVSGAILLWAKSADVDSAALSADMRFRVRRGDVVGLFDSQLQIAAGSSGALEVTAEGGLEFVEATVDDLAALGLDEQTIAILEQVDAAGELRIVLIPSQEHAYEYLVAADEAFALHATIELHLRNAPAGTGVAAVVGRPFSELAEFVERGLPGADGAQVQRTINAAQARARAYGTSGNSGAARMCGAFGAEGLALGLWGFAFLPLAWVRCRKR